MYDRTHTIGGSDAVKVWRGEWPELYELKREPAAQELLNQSLPVNIGKALEDFNRKWYFDHTDFPVRYSTQWKNEPFTSEKYKWRRATPDGLVLIQNTEHIWEAKAVNPFWNPANLIELYRPQLMHLMDVTSLKDYAILSVLYLNNRWEKYHIPYDPEMAAQLLKMEKAFYWHLELNIEPAKQF